MALYIRSNDWYKTNAYTKVNGVWKEAKNLYTKTNGAWKPIWGYSWATDAWGACSASCGGGSRTRTVTCVRSDGVIKPDVFCADIAKPATSEICNTTPCTFTYDGYDVSAYITDGSGTVSISGKDGSGYNCANVHRPYFSNPIIYDPAAFGLTGPTIGGVFVARCAAAYGNRSVTCYIRVADAQTGATLGESSVGGRGGSRCTPPHRVVVDVTTPAPTPLEVYYSMKTSKGNQGMSFMVGYSDPGAVIRDYGPNPGTLTFMNRYS